MIKRRQFLKASAAFAAASAAGGFGCIEIAESAPIRPPVVDRVSVRVLVDFGGAPIRNLYDFTDALRRSKIGEVVAVTVLREGKPLKASVTLAQRR